MEKFLHIDFILLLFLMLLLFIVHEFGHWIAYRILGYQATVRKSILIPGVDPKETIKVKRWQGIFIALNGFFFSSLIIILPCYIIRYNLWHVLLLGGIVGAFLDFMWAFGMILQKTVIISVRR